MAVSAATERRLARLAERDRQARASADRARDALVSSLLAEHPGASVRELAAIVDLSPARVQQILAANR